MSFAQGCHSQRPYLEAGIRALNPHLRPGYIRFLLDTPLQRLKPYLAAFEAVTDPLRGQREWCVRDTEQIAYLILAISGSYIVSGRHVYYRAGLLHSGQGNEIPL